MFALPIFVCFFFFFFKQKTAYEIYQCDWSSDVCSSDLAILSGNAPACDAKYESVICDNVSIMKYDMD